MYIHNLDNMVGKYNNTYHRTIKMKPIDVKLSTYLDFGVKNNHKNSKVKVSDCVRISKFVIKKINILYHGHT